MSPMMRATSPSPGTYPRPGWPGRWVALAIALVVAGAGFWWIATLPARELNNAEALLAEVSQRTFDYRLAGAPYALVHPGEHKQPAFAKPVPLLEAESLVARRLAKNPDSAPWLRLRARLEMLDSDPETAIASLQHALEQQPDNPDLLADLGVAYALRADAQNRDVDFAYAIEYLSRSLKAKPNSAVPVFNRAIVYERTYLYGPADGEWRRFLELETSGAWRAEAQLRLANLEQKLAARQTALRRTEDKDPESLLRRLAAGEEVEPEEYLDMVVTEWLPHRWDNPNYERALSALAAKFESRHGDPWLRDVLATPRSDQLVRGLAALAEALKANLADESDRALVEASDAARDLRVAGDRAGALRADVEHVYALHRALESSAECAGSAVAVEKTARAMNYFWILGQATLEEGNCQSLLGDFDAAHREMDAALADVARAGYRDLQLRVTTITQELRTNAGNFLAAWNLGRDGLATYWSGSHPGARGQQAYFNLFRSAESLGQLQTAYVFARASAAAIAETRHRRTEATTRARLARLAIEAGWPDAAKSEYERAGRLFDQLAQTKTDSQYRVRAELNRAEAELTAGAPDAALHYLEAIRQQMESIRAAVDRIRFHNDLGEALWQAGRRQQADQAYRDSIQLVERHLSTLRGARERAGFMLAAGKAYRSLAQVSWDRADITGAWRIWEWYRAGEMPGPRASPEIDRHLPQISHESFLSYATLPDGIVGWIFDDRGIEGHRLAVTSQELEPTAIRFLRECADPSSSAQTIHRDARRLYQWLVSPFAHRLEPVRMLVIEADAAIGAIPMQALMDESSRYLGERFPIILSDGVADYLARAGAGPVKVPTALVVAGPTLGKQMSRTFPPLPQTLREGSSVATRFNGSMLLSQAHATVSALERNLPKTELFHFAGHGFSNATNGGLLLAPEENSSDEAGVLDGKRLEHQDWSRCRLAVLSACSTGTGEVRGPVNPESLVRNLLWAGVARVVASRWNVDADTDVLLMDQFYERLLSDSDVARSLQQAAHHIRSTGATSHPYYWAAFQAFGTR